MSARLLPGHLGSSAYLHDSNRKKINHLKNVVSYPLYSSVLLSGISDRT